MKTANKNLREVSAIVGSSIYSSDGGKLGELEDIVFDTHTGKIGYVVISIKGGFLKIEHEYFAVPWTSLIMENGRISIHADKEILESAPGFSEHNRPHSPHHEFIDSVYAHFGTGRSAVL